MTGHVDPLELADRLWSGAADISDHHPVGYLGSLVEVAAGAAFVPSFGNVAAFATDEGLVLVDASSAYTAAVVLDALRGWSDLPIHTVICTHGHIDHVGGLDAIDAHAAARGEPRPRVVIHEAALERFERYRMTAGYNAAINRRQFGLDDLEWPTEYRQPDLTYRDALDLEVGGERFALTHARGETDDATWVWAPDRGVLATGDLFIWATPNAGNPQKAQRYPDEWAAALRRMARLDAEIALPGHGPPLVGAQRVTTALDDTAALLESLVTQTLGAMNTGATLDTVLQVVTPPAELLSKPYLRPVYDEPEFIVRSVWRRFGGWWDGDPSSLLPAPAAELAAEVARLVGGARVLADRARVLAGEGELRLAGHLAELAGHAAPDDAAVQHARAAVNDVRADTATSTMARGVFGSAAREARATCEDVVEPGRR